MQLEHFCLQTSALNALAVDTDGTDKEVSKVLGDVSQAGTGTQPELPSALLVSPTERAPTVPPTSLPSKVDSNERETSKSKECYTGKVRLCTARYSYNPYDGPNEHPEAELPLVAGKYLYVYGDMDDDGFYQGELPDGQRGLVPSNFVEFVQDKETVLVSEADDVQEDNFTDLAEDTGSQPTGRDGEAEQVPHPRRITLIKQLARSVIVGWEPAPGSISGYEVLVDGEVRCHVSAGSQNKALIEKLDLEGRAYRLSVRSLVEAAVSDEMCCCLLVGRGVVVAPGRLRVDNITSTSAELSWSPSNSNYTHRVLLDGIESVVLGPARYRCSLVGLQPARMYRVRVEARPHRVPWQLPLEQRERKEVSLEFCTQAAGPPLPPQQVQVHCEKASGLLQVSWTPPPLSVTGTSNGASVTGYAVCTKGQRIAEVMFASADFTMVDLRQIQHLDAGEVVVRTLSTQGESQDSAVVNIPTDAMEAPPRPLQSANLPYSQPHSQETGVCSLPWDQPFCPCPPLPPPFNPSLEPVPLRRSPSPQRILPQPRGEPIPHTVAQAIARQAAQRISCSGHGQSLEENEDEDGVCRPPRVRKGTSMDEFLRGSELGRQLMRSHSEENQTESSRGSDLSDIMEEEEDEEDEDLYSEIEMGKASSRPALDPMKTSVTLPKSKHLGQLGQDSSQRPTQRRSPAHQRARTVPAIEITTEANSAEETHNRQIRDESHTQTVSRVFVALFDYDPLSMSPNPDAADEELSFREGQILRVYGEKDADGFYHGQLEGRLGLVPCNMVSEIQVKDDERAEQLLHQGFLSLSTPVKHIERSTRPTPTPHVCRMVALYDYDPRESSPNVDVEAELTFSAGDIITIMGEIDEDGFYCGEVNGHRGLVPSNFLEEVPDDVEVYLTEGQNTQTRTVPSEPSPTHTPQDFSSKRKKGLLSKGKSLLKKLAVVK